MIQYGVTEVFIKHEYYSDLKIKVVKKSGDDFVLCKDEGDSLTELGIYNTDKKLYPIPKGFFTFDTCENTFYIYEDGEHSVFRYKYIKHVGSSRSSKSWSIEESIIRKCESNGGLRVNVWRDTRESLGNSVWKDFRKIFPLSGRDYKFPRNTVPIYFENNSVIEPHGDDTTNAHGITQDIAWLNEPYRMTKETFDQIDQRANQIIIDINPNGMHWSDDLEKHPRCKVIHSTFMLNPFCPIEQKKKILSYDPNNEINVRNETADAYMWSVYGLGIKAERPNRVFKWHEIPESQYHDLNATTYIGVDWGGVDPFGIIQAKYYDGALYLHEINYDSEDKLKQKLTQAERNQISELPEGFIMWFFNKLGIKKEQYIACDTNRPEKIKALRDAGYDYAFGAYKGPGSIVDGVDGLRSMKVYYTSSSINLKYEQENYSREVDRYGVVVEGKFEDLNNHLIDPARYIYQFLRREGIIRNI